jgi:hypothetical protein
MVPNDMTAMTAAAHTPRMLLSLDYSAFSAAD